jgi:F-type H+-transporting ATPase subunit delta
MNESKISVRYAKAFFEAAQDAGSLQKNRSDALLMLAAFKQTQQLRDFMDSPVATIREKKNVLSTLFSQTCDKLTMAFVDLMIAKKREMYLEAALRYFDVLYRKQSGIKAATVTTAVPLDVASLSKLEILIQSIFKAKVEMDATVDNAIIGGVVIKVDDQQYDLSVAAKLKEIENKLLNA